MARPWRIEFPDALYHVTARGNNRQAIFLEDDDRRSFLDLLASAHERYGLGILAFCMMDNHYHLFLRTPRGNLSRGLQWLNTTYAVRFHRRHGRSGHLFQGRFKAVLVVDEGHWLHLSMYLHLNPVRAKVVEDPADYAWSSFRDYTRSRSRFEWLQPEEILAQYGQGASERRRRYRRECLSLAGSRPDWLEQLRSGVILGARETLAEMVRKYQPAGQQEAVPQFTEASRPRVNGEHELARVAQVFGVAAVDLQRKRRGFPPRLAAYGHLVEHCGLSVSETASLTRASTTAVSMGLRRCRELKSRDASFATHLKQLSFK